MAKPDEADVFRLHAHQLTAIEKIRNGSILAGGVGVGKTLTALGYFVLKVCKGDLDTSVPMENPMPLIVITTAKKRDDRDWQSEALHYGLFEDPELSYSRHELIVDSYNNITKYADREGCMFIFDEQKLLGNGPWVKAFLKIAKANQWILLSATPADNWIDYLPIFMANGFFKTRTEFMDNHVITKLVAGRYRTITGYYGERHLKRMRDEILVDMPYDRHTKRHLVTVPVEYDEATFDRVWKKRWNVFEDMPLVDVAEMHRVGRQVVNGDPRRLEKIKGLLVKHPRLIVFYNFNYELEALRTLADTEGITVAEWNGHKHEKVPETTRWVYLVQYTAGAEGWNCITTDATAYYSLTYSHKVFEQSQGRIDRLNTPFVDLWYYVLVSTAKIDKLIWKSLQSKKNFHEGRNEKFTAPVRVSSRSEKVASLEETGKSGQGTGLGTRVGTGVGTPLRERYADAA